MKLYSYTKPKIPYKEIDKKIRGMCRDINKLHDDLWTWDSCSGHNKKNGYISCVCLNMEALMELLIYVRNNTDKIKWPVKVGLNIGSNTIKGKRYMWIDRHIPNFTLVIKKHGKAPR